MRCVSSQENEVVKVYVRLADDPDHELSLDTESFWAEPLKTDASGNGLYRVDNVLALAPFNYQDIVRVASDPGGRLQVVELFARSPLAWVGLGVEQEEWAPRDTPDAIGQDLLITTLANAARELGPGFTTVLGALVVAAAPDDLLDPADPGGDSDAIAPWVDGVVARAEASFPESLHGRLQGKVHAYVMQTPFDPVGTGGIGQDPQEAPPPLPAASMEWKPANDPDFITALDALPLPPQIGRDEVVDRAKWLYLNDERCRRAVERGKAHQVAVFAHRMALGDQGFPLPPHDGPVFDPEDDDGR